MTTTNRPTLRGNRGVRGTRGQRGFTLIEILIVVIILGILAAIVVPQFSSASSDARKSNVQTQLQMLAQQISLYKLQHGDTPPTLATSWDQLTMYTDSSGTTSASQDATHTFGPYLQSTPVNPLTATSVGTVVGTSLGSGVGWVYNPTTGRIIAVYSDPSQVIDEQGNLSTGLPTGW